jgi:putative FmdB family regulatory protein
VPTYDYQCDDCGKTYEVRQRISAEPLTACQHCGGHIRRLLSSAPFILKGGGWYVTDYPSESRKKAMQAEKKGSEPAGTAKPSDGGGSTSAGSTSGSTSTGSTSSGSTPSGSTPSSTPSGSSSEKS